MLPLCTHDTMMQFIAIISFAKIVLSSDDGDLIELTTAPYSAWTALEETELVLFKGERVRIAKLYTELNEVHIQNANGDLELVSNLKPPAKVYCDPKLSLLTLGSPILYYKNGTPSLTRDGNPNDIVKFFITDIRPLSEQDRLCTLQKATLCNLKKSSHQFLKVPESELIRFQEEFPLAGMLKFNLITNKKERVYPPCLIQIRGQNKVFQGTPQDMTHKDWMEYKVQVKETKHQRTRSNSSVPSIRKHKRNKSTGTLRRLAEAERD